MINNTFLNRYYWYQNGRKVENQIQITANIDSGYLMITNYTKDNFGMFYCVAENDYGASVSPFVKISGAGQIGMQFCFYSTLTIVF